MLRYKLIYFVLFVVLTPYKSTCATNYEYSDQKIWQAVDTAAKQHNRKVLERQDHMLRIHKEKMEHEKKEKLTVKQEAIVYKHDEVEVDPIKHIFNTYVTRIIPDLQNIIFDYLLLDTGKRVLQSQRLRLAYPDNHAFVYKRDSAFYVQDDNVRALVARRCCCPDEFDLFLWSRGSEPYKIIELTKRDERAPDVTISPQGKYIAVRRGLSLQVIDIGTYKWAYFNLLGKHAFTHDDKFLVQCGRFDVCIHRLQDLTYSTEDYDLDAENPAEYDSISFHDCLDIAISGSNTLALLRGRDRYDPTFKVFLWNRDFSQGKMSYTAKRNPRIVTVGSLFVGLPHLICADKTETFIVGDVCHNTYIFSAEEDQPKIEHIPYPHSTSCLEEFLRSESSFAKHSLEKPTLVRMVANKNIITRLIEVREFVSLKTPGFHKHRAFVTYLDISSQQSSQLNLVSSPSDDTPHYHRSVSLTSKGCIIDAHTRGIFLNRYRFAKYDVYH